MLRKILISLLLLLVWSSQTVAQETCDVEALRTEISSYAEALDTENVESTLEQLADFALDSVAGCRSPLVFESSELGTAAKIGPVNLEDGYWLASLYIQGFFVSTLEVSQGDCSIAYSPGGIFTLLNDYREKAAENLIFAENGCEFSLIVDSAQSDWRLEISPIPLGNPELVSAYSSEEDGLQAVIGPVEIPEGFYRVTLVAGSTTIVHFEITDGTCEDVESEANPTQLFSTGEATDGEEVLLSSEGCTGFVFASGLDNWTIEFDRLE